MRFSPATQMQAAFLAVCGAAGLAFCVTASCGGAWAVEEPAHPASLDAAIIAAAKRHGVPERLVRRVIMRESKYNPAARNRRYWGLMQISYPTARSMGFKGTPQELLNPVVNLRYAVPYLANAFICAGKRDDAAVRLYAAGYYFTARTRGLLNVLRTAESRPLNGVPDEPEVQPVLASNASAQPPESVGVFGALFSPGQQPQPQQQVAAYSADASPAGQPQTSQLQPGQAEPRPAATEATKAPAGTFKGPNVAMDVGKNGEADLPKKWKRDGGSTVIARGEQGLDKVASRDANGAAATADSGRRSRKHARKFTLVASLDVQPSTAQAYAAPAQDPRFAAAPSQAAIAQVTSGQPPAAQQVDIFGQPMAAPQPVAVQAPESASAQPVAAAQPAAADEEKPKKRRSRRARHHKAKSETQVAQTKEAAPALRTTETQ